METGRNPKQIDSAMCDKKIPNQDRQHPAFSIEKSREVRRWLLDTFADEKNTRVKVSLFDIVGSLILKEKAVADEVEADFL